MPRRELKHPHQVEDWLVELSRQLTQPGQLILIGSGALLWHAFQRGITEPLPEHSGVKPFEVSVTADQVWGEYPNWDDIARFTYGRRMWRLPEVRTRLLAHWLDERHPYRDRFRQQRPILEEVLGSECSPEELDQRLRARNTSLRCVAREIPPVFGSFFE